MRVNGMDLRSLPNSVHFQFHTEFHDLVAAENPTTLNVKALFDAYEPLYDREDEALKRINKSSLTEDIREADRARDETFSSMLKIVEGMCGHFNPAIKAAGKRIQIVVNTYKKDVASSLNSETSAIYNLLQELDLPKYTDDRFNTSLNPWLNELKNRNEALEKLMKDRFKEEGSKTHIVLRDARKELDDAYRLIIERINAAIIMDGPEKYGNFTNTFNAVIEKYSIKHRHHKHPADAGGDGSGDAGEEKEGEE